MVVLKMADTQLCETSATLDRQSRSTNSSPGGNNHFTSSIIPTPDSLNYYLPLSTVEEICYEPVEASQKGEGWPYAPEGWPKPGDKWIWKVGKRKNAKGYWQDRYLILPKRLQKGGRQVWFLSKKSIEDYITREFPGTDTESFFSSFQWRVPCATGPSSEGKTTACGKRVRESEISGNIRDEPIVVDRGCRAGNMKCGLETGKNKPLKAMNCDICCIEYGFCRECSCILCGKTTDQSVGGYNFIRCEGKLNEEFVCGHVAHLECALLCHMAGVEQSIGLDVEYYCRRCDKKTDLMMHVAGLLHTSESFKVRADVEKNLSLALRVMQGTQQIGGRSLQNVIESAVKKLHSGMNLEDIAELHENSMMFDAGKAVDTNERVHYQLEPLNVSPVSLVNSRGEAIRQSDRIASVTEQSNRPSESPFASSFAAGNRAAEFVQPATTTPDIISPKGNSFNSDRLQRRSRLFPEDSIGTSDLLSSPVHITALKFENRIHQALHGLRQSQEAEYKLAQEKLYAQKDLLLNLFQQLDMANSEFTNDTSSSSLENFDDLLVGVSDQVGRLRKENAKFGQMLRITNGFGSTRKDVLRDYFGVSVDDGIN